MVIELAFCDGAMYQIDAPVPQERRLVESRIVAPHFGVANHLQFDSFSVYGVVGVGDVQDIAGVDREPTDFAERIVALENTQPGPVVLIPPEGYVKAVRADEIEIEIPADP